MDVQGIRQEGQSSSGFRLDLIGKLPLIVLVSSLLNRLPREIVAISKEI